MKVADVMEMAYPQKIARDIIIGMARPINQHLIKLVGFRFPAELRRHFKRELRDWLDEIQRIRLKPTTSAARIAAILRVSAIMPPTHVPQ